MRFLTWLRSENRPRPAERRRGQGSSRKQATARPRLEILEGRRVLSTLTVTSSLDTAGAVRPGDGTLRGEILAAAPSGDTIVFDSTLNGQTITLGGSQLEINKNLTIQGPGAGMLTIEGYSPLFGVGSRLFKVDAGANVAISGLSVEGGQGVASYYSIDSYDGYGGGILNLGTLALDGCNVAGNTTGGRPSGFGLRGGGIYNDGTLTLSGCNVTQNVAGPPYGYLYSWGGGIFNDKHGQLTILSTVVLNNYVVPNANVIENDICNLGTMKISKDSTIGTVTHKL
jgi:hypothetical protein